jgi:uncharacterized protein YegL
MCRRGLVVVLLAVLVVVAATPPAGAAPLRQGATCVVTGDKVASPARVRLGETVQIRLTLQVQCPPPTYRTADIVLIVDRSRSMLNGGKLTAAKDAARTFVEATDLTLQRVAVVAYAADAEVGIGLTQDKAAIFAAIDPLDVRSGTDISAAIDVSYDLLQRDKRPDAMPVIILMSDGQPNRPAPDPQQAGIRSANSAKLGGVQLFTVGLGTDADKAYLRQLASGDADFYYSPSPDDLTHIYESIAGLVGDYSLRDLVLDDTLAGDVALVGGSAVPDAVVNGQLLRWTAGLVPGDGLTWVYQIKPQKVGVYPANDRAAAMYTDADATRKEFVFPQPVITVVDPKSENACQGLDAWTIMVHSFPDSVGVSGSNYPGCNNRFDSGDWILGTGYRLPPLTFELLAGVGSEVIFKGQGVPGPGQVDQRLYIRTCQPPPYRLRLVTADLAGYALCPNSPIERLITNSDFRPLSFHRTEVRFGLIRAQP